CSPQPTPSSTATRTARSWAGTSPTTSRTSTTGMTRSATTGTLTPRTATARTVTHTRSMVTCGSATSAASSSRTPNRAATRSTATSDRRTENADADHAHGHGPRAAGPGRGPAQDRQHGRRDRRRHAARRRAGFQDGGRVMVLYTVSTDGAGTLTLRDEMSGVEISKRTRDDSDAEFTRVVASLTRQYVASQTGH